MSSIYGTRQDQPFNYVRRANYYGLLHVVMTPVEQYRGNLAIDFPGVPVKYRSGGAV